MNSRGAYINFYGGHTWISIDKEQDYFWELDKVILNSKFYGGIIQAVDTFDEAIQICGYEPLINYWNEDEHRLGNGGVDNSRIDKVSKDGGLN